MKTKTFSNSKIKKGDYFKFSGKKKVNVYNEKHRKYEFGYYDFDDVNNFHYTKTDRNIEIDFEF